MTDERRPYGPLLEGFNGHHKDMTMSEIAVFAHLVPQAIRTRKRSDRVGFPVGFVPGASANSIAREMGKSRTTVQRALKGLEWNPRTGRRYIARFATGILIHNFPGQELEEDEVSTSWERGAQIRTGTDLGQAQIALGGGPDRARGGPRSSPGGAQIAPTLIEERERRNVGTGEDSKIASCGNVEIWSQVLERVKARVNRHSFETWLKPTHLEERRDRLLVVGVPSQHFADWLSKNYRPAIAAALAELGFGDLSVRFQVMEAVT